MKLKVGITFVIFVALFSTVLLKGLYLQVINTEKLMAYSKSQTIRKKEIFPDRGQIYDRNGRPLAMNVQSVSAFAIPKELKGNFNSLKLLKEVDPKINVEKLVAKLRKRNRYTWIFRKKKISMELEKKLSAIPGIYIEGEVTRIYPHQNSASHILGFVGLDNGGLGGIEYALNDQLKGSKQITKYVRDAKGRPVKYQASELERPSQDLHLSIDLPTQAMAEKYLKEAVYEHGALRGGIGVMDVQTGEILAMASYPSFDPNRPTKSGPRQRRFAFISDPLEPGSTFKTFTVASALESGLITPGTRFYCEKGEMKVGGHTIREAGAKRSFEWLTVEEILRHSSNIGTTKIAFDLTFPRLKTTLESLGLTRETKLELPGESRGIFTKVSNVHPLQLSNMSFGQGVAVTGVQMLKAYGAIAGGGKLISPTVILGHRNRAEQVLSEKTAKQLEEILVKAVEDGTGSNAKIPFVRIAGKTSTAQRVSPKGGYDGYVSGFIGWPVNVKRPFITYVYIERPQEKGHYGNVVAAPVFRKLTEYILIRRKSVQSKDQVAQAKVRNRWFAPARTKVKVYPASQVPDFVGMGKVGAIELAKRHKLVLKMEGRGLVVKQSIPAGGRTKKNMKVVLRFKVPDDRP